MLIKNVFFSNAKYESHFKKKGKQHCEINASYKSEGKLTVAGFWVLVHNKKLSRPSHPSPPPIKWKIQKYKNKNTKIQNTKIQRSQIHNYTNSGSQQEESRPSHPSPPPIKYKIQKYKNKNTKIYLQIWRQKGYGAVSTHHRKFPLNTYGETP